jgi:hypothetical protein
MGAAEALESEKQELEEFAVRELAIFGRINHVQNQ